MFAVASLLEIFLVIIFYRYIYYLGYRVSNEKHHEIHLVLSSTFSVNTIEEYSF